MEGWYFLYVAKTKALFSCAVTVQLICAFVFAYAKSRFSHDAALLFLRFYFFFCQIYGFAMMLLYVTHGLFQLPTQLLKFLSELSVIPGKL